MRGVRGVEKKRSDGCLVCGGGCVCSSFFETFLIVCLHGDRGKEERRLMITMMMGRKGGLRGFIYMGGMRHDVE